VRFPARRAKRCPLPRHHLRDPVKLWKIKACLNLQNQSSINSEPFCSGSVRSFGDDSSSEAIQPSLIYTILYKPPAVRQFCAWCDGRGIEFAQFQPIIIAGYIEQLCESKSKPTVKQHLAAIRML